MTQTPILNREDLLRNLTELDFIALDLGLYLNINPNCATGLEKYNNAIAEADKLRQMYEEAYGPLASFRSHGRNAWAWSANPWPWQQAANFNLK